LVIGYDAGSVTAGSSTRIRPTAVGGVIALVAGLKQ
jgi:hypothetical protein